MIPIAPPGFMYSHYSSTARTLFNAMSVQATGAQKRAIDNCINTLIADGVWSDLECLQVYAQDTSQAALLNWVNPAAFTATLTNAPTFAANTGFLTNGTSSYVDTTFNPSTAGLGQAQDDAFWAVWCLTAGGDNDVDCGAADATNRSAIRFSSAGSTLYTVNQALAVSSSFLDTAGATGFFAPDRAAGANVQCYRNGVQVDTEADASNGVPNATFKLGTSTGATFAARRFACFATGKSIGALQLNLYNALHTYMVAVGASA